MKREPGESDNQFYRRLMEGEMSRRRQMLQEARVEAAAGGKEEFDFARFQAVYRPFSPVATDPQDLEYTYYVVCRGIATITEFARKMEESELYDGGDLRWD